MRFAAVGILLAFAAPAAAQPTEYSMGLVYGHDCCAVTGQVTDPLNDHLAAVGGAYWGIEDGASPAVTVRGFYGGPRLYGVSYGRLRPFWEATLGFWQSSLPDTHGFVFTPAVGFEVDLQRGARVRASAGFGVGGRGFNVTTAVVLIGLGKVQVEPQRERRPGDR